jgi:hypothetical protein
MRQNLVKMGRCDSVPRMAVRLPALYRYGSAWLR